MLIACLVILFLLATGCSGINIENSSPEERCARVIEQQMDDIRDGADPNAPEYQYAPRECASFTPEELAEIMRDLGYDVEAQ